MKKGVTNFKGSWSTGVEDENRNKKAQVPTS